MEGIVTEKVSSFSEKAVLCFWEGKRTFWKQWCGWDGRENTVRAGSEAMVTSQSSGAELSRLKKKNKKVTGSNLSGVISTDLYQN